MMSEYNRLPAFLREWDGRRRLQELLRYLPLGLAVGLFLGLGAALLSRARPWLLRGELALLTLAAALIVVAVTGLMVMARRRSPGDQARFADRQFGLRERMTAAVEIQSGQLTVDGAMATRQLNDALRAASAVDASRQLPLRLHLSDWLPALAGAILLAAALWLPNPQEAAVLEQRAVAAAVAEQSQTLTELIEEIKAADTLTSEQQEALTQPLEEALTALNQPNPSREEAVAALSAAETELRALSRKMDPASLRDTLAAAAMDQPGELAEMLRAGQPDQAAAAASDLAASLGDLDAAARAELAEQLTGAASALESADAELAETLDRAAEALAADDTEAAQEALDEAAGQLAERAQAADAAARAAGTADQLSQARGEVAQGGTGEQTGGAANGTGESSAGGQTGEGGAGQNGAGESGGASTGGQTSGTGGPAPGGGHVENVFVPQRPDLEGEGEDIELDVQCLTDPASCGPLTGQSPSSAEGRPGGSLVPYDQVFGNYRDAAFEALSQGNIPIGLQDLVRDYFSALEP